MGIHEDLQRENDLLGIRNLEEQEKVRALQEAKYTPEITDTISARDRVYSSGDPRSEGTSSLLSYQAAARNIPLFQTAIAQYNDLVSPDDPDFDPLDGADLLTPELGAEARAMLLTTNSKPEFDAMELQIRKQNQDAELANKTALGVVTQFAGSMISAENALTTIGTLGVAAWGVSAKNLANGIMANAIKGTVAGAGVGYIGARYDAASNVSLSYEDIGWSSAINAIAGGLYARQFGNVYQTNFKPTGTKQLNSIGGAFVATVKNVTRRAMGEGMKEHTAVHGALYAKEKNLIEADLPDRTGIHKQSIKNIDFSKVHDKDPNALGKEIEFWEVDNDMELRRRNITEPEKKYDKVLPFATLASTAQNSPSPMIRGLGHMMTSTGTGAVVKVDAGDVRMEKYTMAFSNGYSPHVRAYRGAYISKVAKENNYKWYDKVKNHMRIKHEFDKELLLHMNELRNGTVASGKVYSKEVQELAKLVDLNNARIFKRAQDSGLTGFDKIKFLKGYIPQRHLKSNYLWAKSTHGEVKLIAVIKKALMSDNGAKMTIDQEAEVVAKAFVDRFTTDTRVGRAGDIMEDDAWSMLEAVFKDEGIELSEDLRNTFNAGARKKAAEVTKISRAKGRIPLDLNAEVDGLRMIDLVETDVDSLMGGYARSMAGHVALAEKGFKDKHTWEKFKQLALKEDPSAEEYLDTLYDTFTTGRVAGGVRSRAASSILKMTTLSMLNNMGQTQLTEIGSASAAYSIVDVFKGGSESMRNMITGKTSIGATKLSNEIVDFFPVGRDHYALASRHMQYLADKGTEHDSNWLTKLENTLTSGIELQGMTSGFDLVRANHQQMVFNGLIGKIGRHIHKGKQIDEQLAALGFSEDLFDKVKGSIKKHGKLYKKGSVKGKDGHIEELGFSDWDSEIQDLFTDIVVTNQTDLVQKALAGQSSAWMSADMGALLLQFRKFPIESVRKQLIRKHTIDDKLLLQSMIHNTIIAGAVITSRNYLNGGNTEADLGDALRNGIMYNADLGSVAMVWDLGLSLTGAPDAMYINPYAQLGGGVFQLPALSAANNLANTFATAIDATDAELDADSYRTLRSLPIIGNIPLLGALQRPSDD